MNALLDNLFCKTRRPRWKIAYRLSGMKLLVKGVFLDMMSLKILLNVVFKPVSFNKKKKILLQWERKDNTRSIYFSWGTEIQGLQVETNWVDRKRKKWSKKYSLHSAFDVINHKPLVSENYIMVIVHENVYILYIWLIAMF